MAKYKEEEYLKMVRNQFYKKVIATRWDDNYEETLGRSSKRIPKPKKQPPIKVTERMVMPTTNKFFKY